MNWKPGDDPESEHKLYFPHCDFLKQKREKDDTGSGITILIIFKSQKCLQMKDMFKRNIIINFTSIEYVRFRIYFH